MTNTVAQKYTATIGIECHVQLKTNTKLFSAADNDARNAPPNTRVNHIDFGLPGALPVLNEAAIPLAIRAAIALGTVPQQYSTFDRKHYFYPDLPMGYQITQFEQPIILGGKIAFTVDGVQTEVGITRAHLEADAGKSIHPAGADYSLVDLNRAGTPLLEIVSEPDMHSAAEARQFAKELYLRMKYAEVSEANLFYGNMRFDVNVSVSKTDTWGTRTETKNLNSFRSVEKAVEYEIARQIAVLESGDQVVQETRGWNDSTLRTFSQRTKEDAHDYRYFPDPDLPPITISDDQIAEVRAHMPMLPDEYRNILHAVGLEPAIIEDIIAYPVTAQRIAQMYESAGVDHARRVAFWLLQPQQEETAELDQVIVSNEHFVHLSRMVADNKLNSSAAKEVLSELFKTGEDPQKIAERLNLLQVSDESVIADIVAQVIATNSKAADDVKNGEMKAIGFLTGQVMKLSQGKANPALAQDLIKRHLGL